MDVASLSRRAAALRLGGAMLGLGALAWLVLSGLHGERPVEALAALQHASGTLWRPVHLLTIVAIAVVGSGAALVTGTLMVPWAFVLGRAGTMIVVPAGAVLGVDFAIGGYALSSLAERYAGTSDQAKRDMILTHADSALTIIGATSFSYQTLFGLAVAILAAATLVSKEYPRLLTWLGVAGGIAWVGAGLMGFSRGPGAGFWMFVLPVTPVTAWMLGVGWLAWRKGTNLARHDHPGMEMAATPGGTAT